MATRTVSTTASVLLLRNRYRKSFAIQNEDAAINCFLKQERAETLTVTTTDHDHRLGPGTTLALNSFNDGAEQVQDRWSIISESGTPRISSVETEDVIR